MEDTVDVATQWVEEMEAGSQTDSVLNSSTQTIDDLSGQEEKGEEEEEEEEVEEAWKITTGISFKVAICSVSSIIILHVIL